MKFDINEIIANMMTAAQNAIGDDWDIVKSTAHLFFQRRKERLELLTSLRISKDLTQKQFETRIADERDILEADFHAISSINKAMAQNAANAAIDILINAAKNAVKIAL